MEPLSLLVTILAVPVIIIYFWALYTGRLEKPDEPRDRGG